MTIQRVRDAERNAREFAQKARDIRIAYVEKQILPWLIGHLQARSVGLQVFIAVQGGLMVAYATSQAIGLVALGIASALALILWDTRNRDVFQRLHKLAEELADREIFGLGEDGMAKDGLHRQAIGTLAASGSGNPHISLTSGLASHTWAIRIIAATSLLFWLASAARAYVL